MPANKPNFSQTLFLFLKTMKDDRIYSYAVLLQIDAAVRIEFDSFIFQVQPLHVTLLLIRDRNFTLRIHDAVPRKLIFAAHRVKNPHHLPRRSGAAGRSGNLAVGHHPAGRNSLDDRDDLVRKWLHDRPPISLRMNYFFIKYS